MQILAWLGAVVVLSVGGALLLKMAILRAVRHTVGGGLWMGLAVEVFVGMSSSLLALHMGTGRAAVLVCFIVFAARVNFVVVRGIKESQGRANASARDFVTAGLLSLPLPACVFGALLILGRFFPLAI